MEQSCYYLWSLIFQVLTVAVVFWYALQAKRSAEAMEKSVSRTLDETSPHVYPHIDEDIIVKNYGKVPAKNVKLYFDPVLVGKGLNEVKTEEHFAWISPGKEEKVKFNSNEMDENFINKLKDNAGENEESKIDGRFKDIPLMDGYNEEGKLEYVKVTISYYSPDSSQEDEPFGNEEIYLEVN